MTHFLLVALLAAVSGCIAVEMPPAAAADPVVTPSLDLAMPAPQEPCDTTVITAAETVGAASNE